VVHPGAIATNITENSGLGKPKMEANAKQSKMAMSAGKAADKIISAMENDKYRVTIGKDATILDLLYRFNPKMATNFIGKMMRNTKM
jgi:short-subunit dehydrogenase